MYFSRFFAGHSANVNFTFQPIHVSEDGFRTCSTEGGIPIITLPTDKEFVVDPKFLSPGVNYFIGKSIYLYLLFSSDLVLASLKAQSDRINHSLEGFYLSRTSNQASFTPVLGFL